MATGLFVCHTIKSEKNNGPIVTFCNNQGEIEEEDDDTVQGETNH